MMSVAKQKIQMKSFQPTLIDIPEDYGHLRGAIKANRSNSVKKSNSFSFSVKSKLRPEKENILEEEKTKKETKSLNKDETKENKDHDPTSNQTDSKPNNAVSDHNPQIRQNIVGEIVQNLESKMQINDGSLKPKSLSFCAPRKEVVNSKIQKRINSFKENNSKYSNKPLKATSIRRNWSLKENRQQLKSSVENIKQEIQSKLHRVSSISRIQSFKKNKKEIANDSSPESSLSTEARKNKVNRWLHSIEIQTSSGIIPNKSSLNEAYKLKSGSFCIPEEANSSNCSSMIKNKTMNDLGAESRFSAPYNSNEDFIPCQQDNEVSIIDINTHFYEKTSNNFLDKEPIAPFMREKIDSSISFEDYPKEAQISKRLSHCHEKRNLEESYNLEENSYEEIMYGQNSKIANRIGVNSKISTNSNINCEKLDSEDENFRLFDTSDSLNEEDGVLENEGILNQASNNFLCIELSDDSNKGNIDRRQSFNKERKRSSSVKRNDSIIQDSLERPKIKKKLNSEDDKTKDCTSEMADVNMFNTNWNIYKPDKNSLVRRSKTMKTFKDYKRIKFGSKSNESKLTFFGEGINLNYCSGRPNESKALNKPLPMPPKYSSKGSEIPNSLESLFHREDATFDSMPPKSRIKYSNSFSPLDFGQRQKHLFQIYSDTYGGLETNNSYLKELNNFDVNVSVDSSTSELVYDPIDVNKFTKINELENCYNNQSKNEVNLQYPYPSHFQNPNKNKSLSCNQVNSKSLNVLPTSYTRSDELDRENTEYSQAKHHGMVSLVKKDSFFTKKSKNLKVDSQVGEKTTLPYIDRLENPHYNETKSDWNNYSKHLETGNNKSLNRDKNLDSNEGNQKKGFLERKDSFYKSSLSKAQNAADQIKSNLKKCHSVTRQSSFKKRTSNFIQRSVSLHRMAQDVKPVPSFPDQKDNGPRLSIYVNNSFSLDD